MHFCGYFNSENKAFTVGIFYRPPNKTNFVENISEDFHKLHSENNDLFILVT